VSVVSSPLSGVWFRRRSAKRDRAATSFLTNHKQLTSHRMKIATWNVNSIIARLPLVIRWLEKESPDILCIQETKCADDKFPLLELKSAGYDCVLFGQQSYNGVAIISRAGCASVIRGFPEDDSTSHSRLLAVDIAGIHLVNVYVPNGQLVGADKYQFKL